MRRKNTIFVLTAVIAVGVVSLGTWKFLAHVSACRVESQSASIDQWPILLKLDPNQKEKIEPMMKQFKEETDEIQARMAVNHISLCQLMMTPDASDKNKVAALLKEAAILRQEKDTKMVDHLFSLRGLLNPEQQKILFTTMMKDICAQCRIETGGKTDYCRMCKI